MFRFIHAADFHLDSPFGALTAQQAAARRREGRELCARLADYAADREISLVLLAGDLFDSAASFRETGEELAEALGRMEAQVCVAPGNHDWYGPASPWTSVAWPENVHIFRTGDMTALDLPELRAVVHGAAFTAPRQERGLLTGFSAPEDGRIHIGLLHGELDAPEARYDPISREEIAASGLDYLALGHVHKRCEPFRLGRTLCAWPGCVEGRGFDELGEKGFYEGTVDGGSVSLRFVPFARRRYEILEVDVTGQAPLAAVESALPEDTAPHLYRILLSGEAEAAPDLPALREALGDRFYALELRDRTRPARDIWAREGEDSLRGAFLRDLRARMDAAQTDGERETILQAARFGLAALDHRDMR